MRRPEPISRIDTPRGTRYRIRVDAGYTPDGRRRQVSSTHDTLKEARLALARIRTEVQAGTFVGKTTVTVRQQYQTWLAGKRKIRPTTRQHYADVAALLLAQYGDLPVHRLSKAHLDALVTQMLTTGGADGTGRSVSYVRTMLIGLGQALDLAVAERLCASNVARLVELPERPLPQPVTWTPDQARQFLTAITGSREEALWRLTMAGMRRGEVMGLTWVHVDLEARTVAVEETRVNLRGSVIESLPKTRRGHRVLPIWDALEDALRRLRSTQAAERLALGGWTTDLLAVDPTGRPILPRTYADRFKAISRSAGLPPIPLKNARHTSVTLMRNEGVPDHIVAAWHGHDETVMRSTYTDAQAPQMRSAADVVQSL